MRTSTLFGTKFDDALARQIMSNVATWPKAKSDLTDRLGNFARVVKWKARRGAKKREQIIEARNHPAVDWLLEIIIPALCDRNAQPVRLIADAIEAQKSNAFPDNEIAFTTWQTACELSGHVMPFNAVGEQADVDMEQSAIIRVPATESELRRKVEKRLGWAKDDLNPGTFTKLLSRLGITCRKKPNSGGRGRKVLQRRTARQKQSG